MAESLDSGDGGDSSLLSALRSAQLPDSFWMTQYKVSNKSQMEWSYEFARPLRRHLRRSAEHPNGRPE